MDLELAGKVAVVTGASAGLGRAIATSLVEEGANVAVLARRAELLESLAADSVDLPGTILVVPCDVTSGDERRSALDTVAAKLGAVSILVNNAGYSSQLPLDAPEQHWRDAFELNFHAVRQMTHAILPVMMEHGTGSIVNVTGAKEPQTLNASIAAKAAVHGWAKGLSRDVALHGITVNNAIPGRLHSEQIDERLYPDSSARDAFIRDHIPMGRFGQPEDMANLVAFLVSDRARYITGQSIAVDGGMQRNI